MKVLKFLLPFLILIYPSTSYAYIGPGLGIGAVLSALSVVVSILLGILAVIYYPLKRFLKKNKNKKL